MSEQDENKPEQPKLMLKLVMPSEGDMELLDQDGGSIVLSPIYYGNESMGPHIQLVSGNVKDGVFVVDAVQQRYRLKLKADGKIELKKGQE